MGVTRNPSEKPAPFGFVGNSKVLLNPHGAALKLAELKAGGLMHVRRSV